MYVTTEKLEKMEALAKNTANNYATVTRFGKWHMQTVYDDGGFDFWQRFKISDPESYLTVYWSHTSQEPYL